MYHFSLSEIVNVFSKVEVITVLSKDLRIMFCAYQLQWKKVYVRKDERLKAINDTAMCIHNEYGIVLCGMFV